MKSYYLYLSFILTLFLLSSASAEIIYGTQTTFTAGNMSSSLDLSGDVQAASFGSGGDYTVGGIAFSGTTGTDRISFGSGGTAAYNGSPYPDSGDFGLDGVLSSGIHTSPFIDITSVTGQLYDIQLLFYGSQANFGTDRTMDISVNGTLFADDFLVVNNQYVIYKFSVAADQDGIIDIDFTNGSNGDDGNPFVQGIIVTRPQAIPKLTAEVQTTTGQSLSITPVTVQIPTTSGIIPDVGAVLTLEDSSTTIQRDDGSVIEVKQDAVVILNPSVQTDNSIALIRGEVTASVNCNYEIQTPLANITSCPTTQRSTESAKFTTTYSQTGIDGKLTVKVISGTVDVTDRNGKTVALTAGQETVIEDRVPRTSWVLPIDNDKIYGGKTNVFIWTEYPDADSYLLELNLPEPVFHEPNASSAEFPKQTIPLTSNFYTKYDGLIIFTVPLPKGADGIVVEMRLFALDAAGNIIGESVSSDSSSVTVTD
ncbi:MAG: FecR family protein [gamma proteobacterium symbiont of Taylorina sp.]|nr:FecR family protein [gamma proteobacterium symbiont of Taylorina sp.]